MVTLPDGSRAVMFEDHWVPRGPGAERNDHRPVDGVVVSEEYVHPHWVRQFSDGRTYSRHHNYWDPSPYGWVLGTGC